MPISTERHPTHLLIKLERECGINSAGDLKAALLDGLCCGQEVRVDLEQADEIDLTVLQLLWAAERDLARAGCPMVTSVPAAIAGLARDAGFEHFPGEMLRG